MPKVDKFFRCDKNVTMIVFKANMHYKVLSEDEDEYLVRDEQGEINHLPKNLKYANSVHKMGEIITFKREIKNDQN